MTLKGIPRAPLVLRRVILFCATIVLLCRSTNALYTPYIDGKYYSVGMRNGIEAKGWMKGMGEYYGSKCNSLSCLIPGAMVDNNGDLYTVFEYSFHDAGYQIRLDKRKHVNHAKTQYEFYPWQEIFSNITYKELDYPSIVQFSFNCGDGFKSSDVFKNEFKTHVHNVFQFSIAQEIEGVNSNYVYLIAYMPPARYRYVETSGLNIFQIGNKFTKLIELTSDEGIFILKIKKSDFTIVEHKLYSAEEYVSLAYNRTPSITNTFDYKKFNLLGGNYHGFFDGEYIWIFYLAQESDTSIKCKLHYLKIKASDLTCVATGACGDYHDVGGKQIVPRFQKLDNKIYHAIIENGFYYRLMWQDISEQIPSYFSSLSPSFGAYNAISLSRWLVTENETSCNHTTFHSDFCMVRSDTGVPIWCLLAFNSKAKDTNCTSEHYWDSTYMNWTPTKVCLCLSSYPINDNGFIYPVTSSKPNTDTAVVYPSDTIYSTMLTQNDGSINTVATSYDSFGVISSVFDYMAAPLRLYLNTHKIVPYTSPTGKRYFIFAYCYPGKKTHLYLGYCTYSIDSSNFVHLGTQIVLKGPDNGDTWGDSFSNLTDCSRIISLDVKNGEVWATWMSADDKKYYCFHVKATDLIPE